MQEKGGKQMAGQTYRVEFNGLTGYSSGLTEYSSMGLQFNGLTW